MAPHMFSYLRPGHSRRNASSTSLVSPNPSIGEFLAPSPALHPNDGIPSPRVPDHGSYTSASPVSPLPPQLPPIPRVAARIERGASPPAVPIPQPPGDSSQHAARPGLHVRPPSEPVPEQTSPSMGEVRPPSRPATSGQASGLRAQGVDVGLGGEHLVQSHTHTPTTASSAFLSPNSISSNYPTHSRSQSSLLGSWTDKLSSSPKMSSSTPTAPPKSGKSRLSFRNPMTLFSRRRSGEALESLADESLVSRRSPSFGPAIPDDYDPSIRGRIVHDFSIPRPTRNFSHSDSYGSEKEQTGEAGRVSPPKIERQHTPVFREHFDDDTSYEQSQAAIRAENLANNDFLKRNSWQPPPPGQSPSPPSPLPKDSPPVVSPETYPPQPETPILFESSLLSPVLEAPTPMDGTPEQTPQKRKSTKTPPPARSRATSINDTPFVPAGLSGHQTSKASRFSFQIAGNDSAQEKILEERHIKKEAEKASKQVRMSTNTVEDDYDDEYDYDMDDGLEEDIPMLGGDDDGFGDEPMSTGMGAFDFSSLSISGNNTIPLTPIGMNGLPTPRDPNGCPIGFAMSEDMLQQIQPAPSCNAQDDFNNPEESSDASLGYEQPETNVSAGLENSYNTAPDDFAQGQDVLEDDLYFDDGMIDEQEQGEVNGLGFDESVFDDPSGPLFDRKLKLPPVEERRSALQSNPPEFPSSDAGYEGDEDDPTSHLKTGEPSLMHQTSMAHQRPTLDLSNLQAYHNALAEAAQKAEAEGRFVRKASVVSSQSYGIDDSSCSMSNSGPSLVPDDGRVSQETTGFPPDDDIFGMGSGFPDDYDYSDYDSALEDDAMIAAANAEALAIDDDGFYGQEFGFYANAQGESWNAYGGFFGSSNLGRSKSGRNAVQEPNLTPITERSEYSTRNSFVSINHFRDGQPPLQSPGLAQLARMSPYGWPEDDPEMSIGTLMKLRKDAFGGSAVSGGSGGTSPRNSSPIMGVPYLPRNASPMSNYPVLQSSSPAVVRGGDSSSPEDGHTGNVGQDHGSRNHEYDHNYDPYATNGPQDDDNEGCEYGQDALDAVNASGGDYGDESDAEPSRPESPTLTASDYNSLSSPSTRDDMPSYSISPPRRQAPKPPPQPLTISTNFQQYQPAQSIKSNVSSPTLVGPTPRRTSQSLGLVSPVATTSPSTPGGSWSNGHNRKTSTTDSIHYVKERDEMGERWVLERRRTAESGELEIIGREIVSGTI